jgi:hypothetical protein
MTYISVFLPLLSCHCILTTQQLFQSIVNQVQFLKICMLYISLILILSKDLKLLFENLRFAYLETYVCSFLVRSSNCTLIHNFHSRF